MSTKTGAETAGDPSTRVIIILPQHGHKGSTAGERPRWDNSINAALKAMQTRNWYRGGTE